MKYLNWGNLYSKEMCCELYWKTKQLIIVPNCECKYCFKSKINLHFYSCSLSLSISISLPLSFLLLSILFSHSLFVHIWKTNVGRTTHFDFRHSNKYGLSELILFPSFWFSLGSQRTNEGEWKGWMMLVHWEIPNYFDVSILEISSVLACLS